MANNAFGIMVNTQLDTKQAEQQLKTFTKSREIVTTIKIKNPDTKEVETAIKKVSTLVDAVSGKNAKKVDIFDLDGNKISSEVKSVSDSFKNLVTATNDYKAGIRDISTETENYKTVMNGLSTDVSKVSKTYTDANGNQQTLIETTKRWVDENNKLHTSIEKTDSEGNKLAPTINKIADAEKEVTEETSAFSQVTELLSSRFTAVNIASRLIQEGLSLVKKGFSDAMAVVKEFDDTLIEFQKVSDLSGASLQNYISNLAKLGELTGTTMNDMVAAATSFKKSGFSDEDSAKLASIAEMYRNIADEEISSAESASFIISQMKAFNIEADNAMHITDAINEVSNNYAVSSADLANNVGKVSAALKVNGIEFEEQLGLMTAITEVTRNASTAARGLTAISSRMTQMLDETSSTGKKLRAIYEGLGIAIEDENGQMRGSFDILKDLAAQWDGLSSDQQKYIALTSAGANQIKNFSSLLGNFDVALSATETAYNSAGSAARENEKAMDSIEKKTQILQSQFQQLVIGDGGLQDVAKGFLDAGISIMKFANGDIGVAIGRFAALEAALLLTAKAWKTLKSSMSTSAIMSAIQDIAKGETSLKDTISSLTSEWSRSGVVATIVAASYAVAAAAVEKYNNRFKEQKEKIDDLVSSTRTLQDEYEALKSKSDLSESEKNRLNLLNAQIEANKILIQQEYEKLSISKQQEDESKAIFTPGQGKRAKADYSSEKGAMQIDTEKNSVKELIEAYDTLSEVKAESIEQDEEIEGVKAEIISKLTEEGQSLYDLKEKGVELTEYDEERLNMIESLVGVLNQEIEANEDVANSYEEEGDAASDAESEIEALAEAHGVALDTLKDMAQEISMSEEELLNYADAMGVTVEQAYEYQRAVQGWNSSIDSLQSSYSTLTAAVDEYNNSGSFTLDTLQSLLNLSPEYLMMLSNENGQLVLNEQAIIDKANALIEERKQTAMQMAMDKLAAIERGENAGAAESQAGSIGVNIGALNEETNALSINTVEQYKNKIARDSKGAKYSAAARVVDELRQELKVIDSVGKSYGKVSTSAIKSGNAQSKAAKGASKAVNDTNKELEKLKSNYERVISYINKRLDKKISGLQDEKSKALDNIDDEIDGIKAEEDAAIKSIENVIKAREKEKKEAIDGISARIKLLQKEEDASVGALKGQKKDLQKAEDEEIGSIEKKIKLLQKEKSEVEKETSAEIDALKKLKEEREAYWDEQIDALKKSNDQRQDAIELQEKLDALEAAKAQKVKVYKQGEGFVYDTDRTKVAEAQKDLDEYLSQKAYEDELARLEDLKAKEIDNYSARIDALNAFKEAQSENYQAQIDELQELKEKRQEYYDAEIEALDILIEAETERYESQIEILQAQKEQLEEYYEEQLDALEEYRDNLKENYERQIEDLEERKEALERHYDDEIEYYQNYKEQFEDMCNAYQDEQDRLLAEQLTGLSMESDTWMTRLDNLAKFVNNYNALLKQLDSGNTNVSSNYNGSSTPNYTKSTTSTPAKSTGNAIGSSMSDREYQARVAHQAVKYGDGIESVPEDQTALVGDDPAHKELVIGSKLNGTLMNLSKGSRVVSAKETKSMAKLLNQMSVFGGSNFGNGSTGNITTTTNNNGLNVNSVTINGAQINDANSFKAALEQMKNSAIQRAYKR